METPHVPRPGPFRVIGPYYPQVEQSPHRLNVEALEAREVPALVSWVSPVGGLWNNPINWSGGMLPTSNDDVSINLTPAQTVTVPAGYNAAVHSVVANARLDVSGGLTVAAPSAVFGELDVASTGVVTSAIPFAVPPAPPGEELSLLPFLGTPTALALFGGGDVFGQLNTLAGSQTTVMAGELRLAGTGALNGNGWYSVSAAALSLNGDDATISRLYAGNGSLVGGPADLLASTFIANGATVTGPVGTALTTANFFVIGGGVSLAGRHGEISAGGSALFDADLILTNNATLTNAGAMTIQQGTWLLEAGTEFTNDGNVVSATMMIQDLPAAPGPRPVVRVRHRWDINPGHELNLDGVVLDITATGYVWLKSLNGANASVTLNATSKGTHAGTVELDGGTKFYVNGSELKLMNGSVFEGNGELYVLEQGSLRVEQGNTASVELLGTAPLAAFNGGVGAVLTSGTANPTTGVPLKGGTLVITRHFEWNEGDVRGLDIVIDKDAWLSGTASGRTRSLNNSSLIMKGGGKLAGTIPMSNEAAIVADGSLGKGEITFLQSIYLPRPMVEANWPVGIQVANSGKATVSAPVPGEEGVPVFEVPWYNLGGTVAFNNNTTLKSGYYQNGGTTTTSNQLAVYGTTKDGVVGPPTPDAIIIAGGDFIIGNNEVLALVENNVMKVIRLKAFGRLITGSLGEIQGTLWNVGGVVVVGGDGTRGELRIMGSFVQESGRLEMDVTGPFHDYLYVEQDIDLAGTLQVSGDPQLPPNSGRSYRLIEAKPGPRVGKLPNGDPYEYSPVIGQFTSVTSLMPETVTALYTSHWVDVSVENWG